MSATTAEPGLDVLKLAGKSISGWLPCPKTGFGDKQRRALPYTTLEERDALLYLSFHPLVAYIQRGDMKASFAKAHRLEARLRTPFIIDYQFAGGDHEYFIDWVSLMIDGGLFGVEASIEEFKRDDQSTVKLESAATYFRRHGGRFGLFLPGVVSDVRTSNLRRLNAHLRTFTGYDEVEPEITARLLGAEPVSIRELIDALGDRFGERIVEQAAWRRAALAAMEGRLVVDLDAILIDLDTPLSLLAPDLLAILPPELPVSLAEMAPLAPAEPTSPPSRLPGPTVDPESLPPAKRVPFLRNLTLVLAHLDGATVTEAAKAAGLSHDQGRYLVERARRLGEPGLIPYYQPPSDEPATEMDPVFLEPIRKLLKGRKRLTYRQIAESPELQTAAKEAHKATGRFPDMPSYMQVYRYCVAVEARDKATRDARQGVIHVPHSATSIKGYVRSIASPALVLQVDEHWLDVVILTDEGAELTERVHAAVLICAKTGAILAAVLSPRELTEEDYLRAVKQCMEPKDALVRRFRCLNPWPCYGRPVEILSDRGKIVTSEHGTDVLVDRFGINQSFAPPYAPSVKGVVESLFRWITERFTHRLDGTTKSSPADRGAYDSHAEAVKAGITFAEFEELFYRAIVDGYMQDWDDLRVKPHHILWTEDVARFGVPQWLGTSDELKLLLMRSENKKNPKGLYEVHGAGVSFKGNYYVGEEGLTARLRDSFVAIYYDRRDIGTIYLVDEAGMFLGAAHCPAYASRRISVWEQAAERKADKPAKAEARRTSSGNLTTIVGDAHSSKRERKRAAKEASRARFLDAQQDEIHTEDALAERRRLAERLARGPAWQTDPSLLPGPDDESGDELDAVVIPMVRRRTRREVG